MYKSLLHITNFVKGHEIGSRNFFYSLYKFVYIQILFKITNKGFLVNWIDKSKFMIYKGDTGLTGNFYAGLHESKDMGFLLHYLNEKDVFVDIGANMGSYTILSGIVKKSFVHSFEPIPSTFERLQENINLNSNNKKIKLYNYGLGNEKTKLSFTKNQNCINHVTSSKDKNNTIKLNVDTLDNQNLSPSVIKIDVEGFENQVIQGGKKTFSNESLKCLIIEMRDDKISNKIYNHIISIGFKSYNYNPINRKLSKLNKIDNYYNNTLFIRGDLKEVENRISKSKKYSVNKLSI